MRRSSVGRAVFVLVLMILPNLLFAANIRWQWNDIGLDYYRWQLDGEAEDGWHVVKDSYLHADTFNLDPAVVHHFYLQASEDGVVWSESKVETWGGIAEPLMEEPDSFVDVPVKKNRFGLRASLFPYSMAIFDFYNGHDIEGAKFLTMTNYAAAFDAELFWKTPWPLALHLDAGYSFALKTETILPKAMDVHYVRLGGGIDGVVSNDELSFAFGVLGGELIAFNANHWNLGSYLGLRLLLEFNLSDHLLLGCESKLEASYQKATDPLMSSITWLVDPLALTITYRF